MHITSGINCESTVQDITSGITSESTVRSITGGITCKSTVRKITSGITCESTVVNITNGVTSETRVTSTSGGITFFYSIYFMFTNKNILQNLNYTIDKFCKENCVFSNFCGYGGKRFMQN